MCLQRRYWLFWLIYESKTAACLGHFELKTQPKKNLHFGAVFAGRVKKTDVNRAVQRRNLVTVKNDSPIAIRVFHNRD